MWKAVLHMAELVYQHPWPLYMQVTFSGPVVTIKNVMSDPEWPQWWDKSNRNGNVKEGIQGTSLVVQWLRICLPMQGTRVWSLAWEHSTCHGAAEPVYHYWACTLEPGSHNWAYVLQLLKTAHPRAQAPQQEKPQQWGTRASQLESCPHLPQLEKCQCSSKDLVVNNNNNNSKKA